jgi:hypothetical protein
LASVELYDPATGLWSSTGSLATARNNFTAATLPEGKVLAAGGWGGGASLTSAELYDPSSGLWTTATSSLAAARNNFTATSLTNGNVLMTGGWGTASLSSAELYW